VTSTRPPPPPPPASPPGGGGGGRRAGSAASKTHGIPLGSPAGIPVRADWSVGVIAWLITWVLATEALPALAPGYGDTAYWAGAVVTAVVFLAGLLAHELSHSVTARRRGVEVRDIRLWALGGIATLEGEPATPADDLAIAVAGPAASAAIALTAFAAAALAAAGGAPELMVAALVWLATINAVLAMFNLLPAAPLDGGRILRATLWRRRGDRTSATVTAARAGRVMGLGMIWLGMLELVVVGLGGLWTAILGWFVLTAAREEEHAAVVAGRLEGVVVADVMTADPVVVPPWFPIDQLVESDVVRRRCSTIPVVDDHGHLDGLVTLEGMLSVPPAVRATTTAADVAVPVDAVATARPDELLLQALVRLDGRRGGRLVVLDDRRVVGIVSPSDVARIVANAPAAPPRPPPFPTR
jgi:Zn-dependent protease